MRHLHVQYLISLPFPEQTPSGTSYQSAAASFRKSEPDNFILIAAFKVSDLRTLCENCVFIYNPFITSTSVPAYFGLVLHCFPAFMLQMSSDTVTWNSFQQIFCSVSIYERFMCLVIFNCFLYFHGNPNPLPPHPAPQSILPSATLSLWINSSETLYNSHSTRGCKFAWRIWQSPDQIFIPLCKLCQTAPLLWGPLSCLMSPTQPYGIALRIGFSVFYFLPLHSSCVLFSSV